MVIPISTLTSAPPASTKQPKLSSETSPLVVYQLKLGTEYREILQTEVSFQNFLGKYESSTGCRILSRGKKQDRSHIIVEVPQAMSVTAAGVPIDKADLQTWLESQLLELRETYAERGFSGWQGWRERLQRRGRVSVASNSK